MRIGLLLTRDQALVILTVVAALASAGLALAGAIAARRAVLALPPDVLANGLPAPLSRTRAVLRLIAGAALVATGVVLLFLPGPGLALIALGILTASPRWRRHLVRALLARPSAVRRINAYRRRHGRSPLLMDVEMRA
jgi:hypothetical protein